MNRAERLGGILEHLAERGSVDVEDLVEALGVSPATVRRDLQTLHEQRLLERTHGGAVAINGLYELPLRYRGSLNREQKLRIARAAVAHVSDNATVALTGGTTTTEVGRMLVQLQELTVVTNAINIAAELAVRPNIRLIVSGGVARAASYELVGPLADDTLAQLNVELAFVGVDGISSGAGLTTHREVEARTNRMLIDRASRVIVVADGSKVGATALARIHDLARVDVLITTREADADELRAIAAAGVSVETV
ncbi:DeoR/GlpR family DNA-binding transcription regulator [Conexibacter sp. JD483]|uniref:DeoR/GlpR family DNA-binding transcription regulator n=1 Tax=unclassified Conexibacter TaxID=2627773 RepID=UPI002725176E|nr:MULTISPECIES: DeoR/GlpR family DNA-binding transcription regulator [unclassified Conexibacter]MDO8184270.1 DeoR/GlpR family DNA-binding transcription regulator [Conexibacter sp. CPCC 205706]MDO8197576.1 DeoR/GlpR family DNA-binding transcription regulator [Conexibacter sp. CPCC 205762]MDR9371047.1 DeoR/GlpR family DNA-binding transcription regulator [Conexibacter sp. JD483]